MLKLYGHVNRRSPNTLKLRLALAEAGAACDYVPVDLAAGEQRTPRFLAINPHGKVPVLVDEDFILPESDAILWYVAEKFPAARLLPPDIRGRARALQWCDFASTALYPAYHDLYTHTVFAPPEKRIPTVAEAARQRLDRAFGVLERTLAEREHLAGSFTIAELATAALLRSIQERLPTYAALPAASAALLARVGARPSWQRTLADA